jgi:CheY-like chemotaxis protein
MTRVFSILTISRDEVLQNTRTLILKQAGYHVSPARSDEEAIAFVENTNSFDLVLLCHSVPETNRRFLVSTIKALHPKLPFLLVNNGFSGEADVDASLHSLAPPTAMLDMIGVLIGKAGQRTDSHST